MVWTSLSLASAPALLAPAPLAWADLALAPCLLTIAPLMYLCLVSCDWLPACHVTAARV